MIAPRVCDSEPCPVCRRAVLCDPAATHFPAHADILSPNAVHAPCKGSHTVRPSYAARIGVAGFTGQMVVTLTPPVDARVLGDTALWTALAVCGRWSGEGRSYHAATAVVIALQAVTDALRADFPRAHGWTAPPDTASEAPLKVASEGVPRLVYCRHCYKTHAAMPGETPCGWPGSWTDEP